MATLTIGRLAKRAGFSVETVRFYGRRGLLPEPSRNSAGYRCYAPEDVDRLRFIRRAKELGFSLDDIAELLRSDYGMQYTPQIGPDAAAAIQVMEAAAPGEAFDRAFLTGFSMHHYMAIGPSQECLIGRELGHQALRRYCNGIVQGQTSQIEGMRELLCEVYDNCDFQPQAARP